MPVAGRKPKPDALKKGHSPSATYDWAEIPNVPFDGRKPALSKTVGWPEATKRWWKTISAMPHCSLWSEADWQFAMDTALIAKGLHEGDMRQAAELRLREKVMGTTLDSRRDLRIRYVDPDAGTADEEQEVSASVASLNDRRRRLSGAS